MKNEGVLSPIDERSVRTGVLMGCGDSWRIHEGLDYLNRLIAQNTPGAPRPHLYLRNGGPLRFVHRFLEETDCEYDRRIEEMVEEIRLGLGNVDEERIILKPHWPCGQARRWGYTPTTAASAYTQAQELIRTRFLNVEIVRYFHVDWIGYGTPVNPMETFGFMPEIPIIGRPLSGERQIAS